MINGPTEHTNTKDTAAGQSAKQQNKFLCNVGNKVECPQLMGGEGSLFAQLYPPLIMATLLYRALKTLLYQALSTAIAGTTNGNTAVTATQNGSIRFPPSFCHMKGSHISCFTSTINTMRYPTNIQRKRAIDQYYCHSTFRSR